MLYLSALEKVLRSAHRLVGTVSPKLQSYRLPEITDFLYEDFIGRFTEP
jgi:hypothetical protein